MVIAAFNLLLIVCMLLGHIEARDRQGMVVVKLVLLAVFVFLFVTVMRALP